MKVVLILLGVFILIASVLVMCGMSVGMAELFSILIMVTVPICGIIYLTGTRRGKIIARGLRIADIRDKRRVREYNESWHRENRSFIERCEREDSQEIGTPSSDEESSVGYFGSDSGDGV